MLGVLVISHRTRNTISLSSNVFRVLEQAFLSG